MGNDSLVYSKGLTTASKHAKSLSQLKPSSIFDGFPILVRRYFSDVDGTEIAKGAAPAAMQASYPVYMFGNFDMNGGFRIGNGQCPAPAGTFYVLTFIYGIGQTFLPFNGGLNTVKNKLLIGDVIHIFADSLDLPTTFVWIVQSNPNSPLGSVIRNLETVTGILPVEKFQYFADSNAQYGEAFRFDKSNRVGDFREDQHNPNVFKSPDFTNQNNFIDVRLKFKLDQYLGINFYFQFATNVINFNFLINKQVTQ